MIFADTKSNTVTVHGEGSDVFRELLSVITFIIKNSNVTKEELREWLNDDKFWKQADRY
ncbi:hypothetical protein [Campylobacter ureolyticus]|uniref:hypothetical protein n=1 Tax=Campylobacter ureolyticus TaxID=827 RepID=UPI00290A469D|nr:hypothetical protein [Campylobacter ureolyticus]MDU7070046.1 hypothetical protein [Campylobacter ureolyticus]